MPSRPAQQLSPTGPLSSPCQPKRNRPGDTIYRIKGSSAGPGHKDLVVLVVGVGKEPTRSRVRIPPSPFCQLLLICIVFVWQVGSHSSALSWVCPTWRVPIVSRAGSHMSVPLVSRVSPTCQVQYVAGRAPLVSTQLGVSHLEGSTS